MSKNSKLNVLGVMTGSSMDGVDISLINTNGTDFVKIKCEKYENIIQMDADLSHNPKDLPCLYKAL